MKYFTLFSNILITKGANRILISDLQRNASELYPLEFYDLIEQLKKNSIEEILETYNDESQDIVKEYVEILLNNEYGFITENDRDGNFPALSHQYSEPNSINNLFIEMADIRLLNRLKDSVENLEIRHMVIYSSRSLTLEEIINIDRTFSSSALKGIEIISPFHSAIDRLFIQKLNHSTERIYNLIFYLCTQKPFKIKDEFRFSLNFVKEPLKISSCGKVDMKYFNTNLPKVLEAINHNSCLYKKMGIDQEGNIKNCPLMAESFGNIQKISLEDALLQPGFKRYWDITKDAIEGCKDCEFRYICTDCRAYTERSHYTQENRDISKPLKCGYNPYTNEWKDWSKNPLKQKTIQYYGIRKTK
ncbi:grasp-with-spasm system SPASM domain peptide maturase [Chryseobacterium pennae]|uniref:Grasp-with-spasm system SPASM domain peptide maturase n=1 Tax=Chryseobacterium pennae TaxID=2258962 RepID=A0A3D9C370_9FLAO|nr:MULTISPECIES: grasp-with-spasm system SPASM domain peptide maturase [Chryseobacterium]MCS4304958.1 SPASM domain peptide maturase of grasp-with-spasm system [Chryseobacterium sp. BIGb0232]REC60317.1 grasp-with-spasm system SPASM domain peptide maturase [Chryseobacterium pennae]ROS08226.1 SPASM domain peptide maturase of grasp-with-spasm system [Chryseobacterium nakagawai]